MVWILYAIHYADGRRICQIHVVPQRGARREVSAPTPGRPSLERKENLEARAWSTTHHLLVDPAVKQPRRGDFSATRDARELKHPPPHDPKTHRFSIPAEAPPLLVTASLGERSRKVGRITLTADRFHD